MDKYNVVWDSPSKDCYGSMPIGNGDIGLNVWVQADRGLVFYISKTDTWSENCRLLKLGRVRVGISPSPFGKGQPFKQTLDLRNAEIRIEAGEGERRVTVRVWVDANHPVIHVDAEGASAFDMQVDLEIWRTSRRAITDDCESESATGFRGNPIVVEPDTVVPAQKNRVAWYHRNERSMWKDNLQQVLLDEMIPKLEDPLLHRTFGAVIEGKGLIKAGDTSLRSAKPGKRFSVDIHPLTSQTKTARGWLQQLDRQVTRVGRIPRAKRLAAHRKWWADFWDRSWIFVTDCWDAFAITQGYVLQRFINACGGRGAQPIKFNGSIFTVDAWPGLPRGDGSYADADYRRWGGAYWFYNQRIVYYPMFASGDFDLLMPFFKMYTDTLPLNLYRTRRYHGHGGASFPEVFYFWGAITNGSMGSKPSEKALKKMIETTFYLFWEGGLELASMMIDYFEYTQDREFARKMMLPLVTAVLQGYDEHWGRDENGKILLSPACVGESAPNAVNPAPDVAGLRFVLGQLLDLPEDLSTAKQRADWRRFRAEIPEMPTRELNGLTLLAQADVPPGGVPQQDSNAGLFSVWPFRIYGVGKPDLETAVLTFANRYRQATGGHQQEAIQAAMLGLPITAGQDVEQNSLSKDPHSRFPAFWGPNFDYVPDQCHGGTTMTALQKMLVHADGRKIIVFPAWPDFWEVDFKLHAPFNTIIEGSHRRGGTSSVKVTPKSREKDVIVMRPQ